MMIYLMSVFPIRPIIPMRIDCITLTHRSPGTGNVLHVIVTIYWIMNEHCRTLTPSPHYLFSSVQFSSVAQSCPTLCDPMNRSTPGLPVHHQLPEFTQTHAHRVGDAISHLILCHPLLLLPPIPPSIRVFSSESAFHMGWPKYWSFSFKEGAFSYWSWFTMLCSFLIHSKVIQLYIYINTFFFKNSSPLWFIIGYWI